MDQRMLAAIRELEAQRNELLSGLSIQAAYEKAASRTADAVFALAEARQEIAALKAEIERLTKEPVASEDDEKTEG